MESFCTLRAMEIIYSWENYSMCMNCVKHNGTSQKKLMYISTQYRYIMCSINIRCIVCVKGDIGLKPCYILLEYTEMQTKDLQLLV